MRKLVSWVIGVPFIVVAVIFFVINRSLVKIDLWPLEYTYDIPLPLIVLVVFLAGILSGTVITSLARLRNKISKKPS